MNGHNSVNFCVVFVIKFCKCHFYHSPALSAKYALLVNVYGITWVRRKWKFIGHFQPSLGSCDHFSGPELRKMLSFAPLTVYHCGVGDTWPRILYFRRCHREERQSHRQSICACNPYATEAYPKARFILGLEWGDSSTSKPLNCGTLAWLCSLLTAGGSRMPTDPK